MRHFTENPKYNQTYQIAFNDVKKYKQMVSWPILLYNSNWHLENIDEDLSIFKEGRRRISEGRQSGIATGEYVELRGK